MNELSILKGAFRPEFLKDETLVDLFLASVQNHPHKTALVFANKQFNVSVFGYHEVLKSLSLFWVS